MSNQPIITVEGLGKRYDLGQIGAGSLREEIERFFRRGSDQSKKASSREFWALRDVNFSVNEGEVLGVVGRNGAGKSTLLKLLSRITEPTEGRAIMRGRVASLLEVGTGFHPELSGRENIYLNGAILGMRKAEVNRKFDEIIDFSGVEQFLDTPVKRYSSGMYVRLAFAVAAHLEPEILIVDEVLAVGDASFQRRCLGKMREVSQGGRTVIFVSHNMSAVNTLCDRGLLLSDGGVAFVGDTGDTISQYLGFGENDFEEEKGHTAAFFEGLSCVDKDGNPCREFIAGDEIGITFRYRSNAAGDTNPEFGIGIINESGIRITTLHSNFAVDRILPLSDGEVVTCTMLNQCLMPGAYFGKVFGSNLDSGYEEATDLPLFRILPSAFYESGHMTAEHQGLVAVAQRWEK